MPEGRTIGIGIAILAVILIGILGSLQVIEIPFLTFGFTTLSLSNVQFFNNDPMNLLNEEVFALTVRQGGLAQSAVGTINAASIQDEGRMVEKGFTLAIDNSLQRCRYPITADTASGRVKNFGMIQAGLFESTSSINQRCSVFGTPEVIGKAIGEAVGWCVYSNPLTSFTGRLKDNANVGFTTDMTLTIDGENPVSGRISNFADTQVLLGDIALAQWQGNLTTGETCPVPSTQDIIAVYSPSIFGDTWKLGSESRFDAYKNAESSIKAGSGAVFNEMQNTINNANGLAAVFVNTTPSFGGAIAADPTNLNNASFFIDLDKQIQFPVITFYVKAESLGVFQPTPSGLITGISGDVFKTGEEGSIRLDYQNVSNVDGGFTISTDCASGFSPKGTSIERQVRAGANDTVFIPVTGGCASPTTGSCTVTLSWLGGSESKTASMGCNPQPVCTPLKVSCIANKVSMCNSAGTIQTVIDDCQAKGQVCGTDLFGNLACVTVPDPGPGEIPGPGPITNPFEALIVGLFGSMLTFYLIGGLVLVITVLFVVIILTR